jgi:two-component system, OmpR family, alkaline phosphatase synthesis response regulator PhoP
MEQKKLLIADDEAHIRLLLAQTFEDIEDEGVALFFAENGRDALALIQKEQPQLILLDVMMPFLNGVDLCKEIRKQSALSDAYVILLTAKGQEIDRQQGSEAGADQYLTKPFDPELLIQIARKVLHLPQ